MEKEEYLRNLVRRYVNNEASDEELEVFFHFLENDELGDTLRELISQESELLINTDQVISIGREKPWFMKLHLVASVILIGLSGLAGIYYFQYGDPGVNAIATREVVTGNNEIKKITLPDGSLVWLNASGKLTYPELFDPSERVVNLLEGEAYFDVKHGDVPFKVFAGSSQTNVLGTAFNIRSYKSIQTVQITVSRGKVAVKDSSDQHQGAQVLLNPNDQAVVNRASGEIVKRSVKSWETAAWRQGDLYFNDERFADIAGLLEKRYGVKIEFKDKEIKEYRFSAGFKFTDPLKDVLEILSMVNNIDYKKSDTLIQFKKRHPKKRL